MTDAFGTLAVVISVRNILLRVVGGESGKETIIQGNSSEFFILFTSLFYLFLMLGYFFMLLHGSKILACFVVSTIVLA